MSSRLRIVATCGKYGGSAAPKVGYTGGMTGTTLMGNAYALPGAVLGWLCSRPVSLLAWRSKPLLMLLNVGRCECL